MLVRNIKWTGDNVVLLYTLDAGQIRHYQNTFVGTRFLVNALVNALVPLPPPNVFRNSMATAIHFVD